MCDETGVHRCSPLYKMLVKEGRSGPVPVSQSSSLRKASSSYKEKTGRSECRRCRGQKNFGGSEHRVCNHARRTLMICLLPGTSNQIIQVSSRIIISWEIGGGSRGGPAGPLPTKKALACSRNQCPVATSSRPFLDGDRNQRPQTSSMTNDSMEGR